MRGRGRVAQGRGTVREGERVIVLTKSDGTMTTGVGRRAGRDVAASAAYSFFGRYNLAFAVSPNM
jgi:hypothetical protein